MAGSLVISSAVSVQGENATDAVATQEQMIQLGTSGMAAPEQEKETWSGDYVYFGKEQSAPMKWRVLDPNGTAGNSSMTGGILLQADSVLQRMAFEDGKDSNDEHKRSSDAPIDWNDWNASDIRTWLQGEGKDQFLNDERVTQMERQAIMKTTTKAGESPVDILCSVPLQGDTVFLLDSSDLANTDYGYAYQDGGDSSVGKHWWLRSAGIYAENLVGYNLVSGYLFYNIVSDKSGGVVPAFNLAKSQVLFSSDADMDKTASFSKVNTKDVKEWKLTLLDQDKKLAVVQDEVEREDDTVTIPYTYEGTTVNQLSIMMTDGEYDSSESSIVYYGKVAGAENAEGTVTVTLPEGFEESQMHVYLIAEQILGGKQTDYAATPVEVTIPPLHEHQWAQEWSHDDDAHWKECMTQDPACDILDNEEKEEYAEHDFDEGEEIKEATCKTLGETKYTCATCGYSYIDKEEEYGDHEYPEEGEVIQAPTCEEDGLQRFTCIHCGESYEEEIESEGHDWGEPEVLKEATCTEDGLEKLTCTVCGDTETEEVEALGHDFGEPEVITPATFNTPGVERYTCETCGAVEDEEIPPLSEQHECVYSGKQVIATAAGCETSGILLIYCEDEDCGQYITQQIPATGHQFGEWKETKKAGFSDDGEQRRVCANCGKEETQVIPKRAQNHVHQYTGKEEIIKDATCTEEGTKRVHCFESECESYIDQVIAKKEHKASEAWWVNETQHWQVCDCYLEMNKANHKWAKGVITKEPTAKAEGEVTYECSVCTYKKTKAMAKLGTKFTVGEYRYKVVKLDSGDVGVSLIGLVKGSKIETVKVKDTVTYNGVAYNVVSIGKKAFCKNQQITKVVIGNHVKQIDAFAFFRADKVQTIIIGTGLERIEEHNFCHLVKLQKIKIQSLKLKKVNGVVFHGNKKITIHVPKKKLNAYKKLFLPGKTSLQYKTK